MDEKLLKKTAVQSVALMLTVVTLSYAFQRYQVITIEASDSKAVVMDDDAYSRMLVTQETSGKPHSLPSMKLDPVFQGIVKEADPEITKQLGERFLIIKKPEGESITLQMEDLFVTKSIRITLTGLEKADMNSAMIARGVNGELFQGDPVYTEIISDHKVSLDGLTETIITKDYGRDIIHAIELSTFYDEIKLNYKAELLITLDQVYVQTLYEDVNCYYIDLQLPREVYDRILVIDAGHGGKDAGALSRDELHFEKDVNLDITLELKKLLDQDKIKVYYTRLSDDKLFLRPRVELANAVDCDFFISIHCNANTASEPGGTEVLYYDRKFKGVQSKDLAEIILNELGKEIPLKNRGLVEKKDKEIFILNSALVPSMIIEVGYMTNNNDMNYLKEKDNRKAIARGIYNGIMAAYNTLEIDVEY